MRQNDRNRFGCGWLIVGAAWVVLPVSQIEAQLLQPLPPSAGVVQSFAQSINSNGVVVGYSSDGLSSLPTIWRPGTTGYSAESLPLPSGNSTGAVNSINGAGVGVGYAQPADASTASAVVWSGSPGAYSANLLPTPSGAALTNAYAINGAGTIAGYFTDANDRTAGVVWPVASTGGYAQVQPLPIIPGQLESAATAINVDGDVAGYVIKPPLPNTSDPILEASVWLRSGDSYVQKEVVAVDSAEVTAMNQYGTGAGVYAGNLPLVMAYYEGDFYAFSLPVPYGSTDGASNAVNELDGLAGYVKDPDTSTFGPEAALWLPNDTYWDYFNLDQWLKKESPVLAAHWTLIDATGLTDDWHVTGDGLYDPDGPAGGLAPIEQAYVLDVSSLVPEPSSLALLLMAALPSGLCRRPRRCASLPLVEEN